MQGFLNINKPLGITSHDVVARVRRLVGRGVKVGHAGTLDPAATGVLPLALGRSTRLIEYLADARKGYRAVVRLGLTTTTDDAAGETLEQYPVPTLHAAMIETALAQFRGAIMQVPPMYSALHHQGQRLYDLARAGKTVERPPRPVTIDRLELVALDTDQAQPELVLDVACSKGTYIRALARDLGAALGTGAHLAALERTFVGSFTLAQATALDLLQANPEMLPQVLLPPEIAVADWPSITLTAEESRRVRNGLPLTRPDLPGDHVRVHLPDGTLLALLRRVDAQDDQWRAEKVFA